MGAEFIVFGLLIVCLLAVMSGGSADGGGEGGNRNRREAVNNEDTQRDRGSFRTDTSNLDRFAPKGGEDRR